RARRHPRDRSTHWRVDEPGALLRPGDRDEHLRRTGGVLGRADHRWDRGGAALRSALSPAGHRAGRSRHRTAGRTLGVQTNASFIRHRAPRAQKVAMAHPPVHSLELARERTIQALCSHFANDRLTTDEVDKRLELAQKAESMPQLDSLLAD